MGADVLTATIAVPADHDGLPNFEAGRRALRAVTDPTGFNFGDPIAEITALLPEFDPEVEIVDGEVVPTLEHAITAGLQIIANLEAALDSRGVDVLGAGGYRIYVAGGMSSGDAPTAATQHLRDADKLPPTVLAAMGVLDHRKPVARKHGSPGPVTDTDVIDAIALGLGTRATWSGADTLEWIADLIGAVREHPGNAKEPAQYLQSWVEQFAFDPTTDHFLAGYVHEQARTMSARIRTLILCECCALTLACDDDSGCRDFHDHTHAALDVPAGTVIARPPHIWDGALELNCHGHEDGAIAPGEPFWVAECDGRWERSSEHE